MQSRPCRELGRQFMPEGTRVKFGVDVEFIVAHNNFDILCKIYSSLEYVYDTLSFFLLLKLKTMNTLPSSVVKRIGFPASKCKTNKTIRKKF
jgi:hypothetical protein